MLEKIYLTNLVVAAAAFLLSLIYGLYVPDGEKQAGPARMIILCWVIVTSLVKSLLNIWLA